MELIYAALFIQGLFWVVLSLSEKSTSKYIVLKILSLAFISAAGFMIYSRIANLFEFNNCLVVTISLFIIWIFLAEYRKKIISVKLTRISAAIAVIFMLIELVLLIFVFYTQIAVSLNIVLMIVALNLVYNAISDLIVGFKDYEKLRLKSILHLEKRFLNAICMDFWQLIISIIIVLSLILPIKDGVIGWVEIATITIIPLMFVFEYLNYKYPITSFKLKPTNDQKYDSHILSEKVKNLMEKEQLYLKNDLSLDDLADAAGVNSYELSHFLNHQIDSSFYRLVNTYRVGEVKKMLNNYNNNKYTLLAIAFECGFNSKSSFNRIFKEFTGFTPKEYKLHKKEQ
ncbi:MAG: AraC family transcriptional regulator [Bacteroidales bacterium]|jgi:AraC-like DNA-binding protein|nr:AraC family transcriptional regulator [Bacteroidales bacterium]